MYCRIVEWDYGYVSNGNIKGIRTKDKMEKLKSRKNLDGSFKNMCSVSSILTSPPPDKTPEKSTSFLNVFYFNLFVCMCVYAHRQLCLFSSL